MTRTRKRELGQVGVVRPHRPRVQLSDEELAEVTRRADAAGMGVPLYLKVRGLSSDPVGPGVGEVLTELLALRRLLSGVANNVNQIARVANATQVIPTTQFEADMEWLRKLAEPGGRLDEAIEQLKGPRRRGRRRG